MPEPLSLAHLAAAAKALGCDLAAVKAVIDVESDGRGFDTASGRPRILYEPHVFGRLTGHRYDASNPTISYREWRTRPYPRTQAERWEQLAEARSLDDSAGLQSTSWGLFQIMGFNHVACGFPTVQAFVTAMHESEGRQLLAFVDFLKAKGLDRPLRAHDWRAFARGYNGKSYEANGYHAKLEAAWRRHGGEG